MITSNNVWKHTVTGLLVVLLALTLNAPAFAKSPLITGVQVKDDSGKLKVLVSSTSTVQYRVINLKDPRNALVLEIFPAQLAKEAKKAVAINKGVVENVRIGQFSDNPDVVRLVVDLKSPAKYIIVMDPKGKGLALSIADTDFVAATEPKADTDLDKPEPSVVLTNKPDRNPNLVAYNPSPKKRVTYGPPVRKVTLDFVNADLIFVLKILAKEMGKNLVTDPNVKGSVTMTLKDVPAEGALKLILKIAGFEYKVLSGNTILVGTAETMTKVPDDTLGTGVTPRPVRRATEPIATLAIPLEFAKASDAASTVRSSYPDLSVSEVPGQNIITVKGYRSDVLGAKSLVASIDRPPPPPPAPPEVDVVYVRYADAGQMLQIVKPMFTDLSFNLDTRLNAFIVSGSPDSIAALRDTLAKIDLPLKQVMLEVKVVDLTQNAQKTLGFTHGLNAQNGVFSTVFTEDNDGDGAAENNLDLNIRPFSRTSFVFTTTLNMLVSNNDAVVMSQPRVVTQSGKTATILVGQKFPIVFFDPRAGQFQVQYVDIGVKLEVKAVATDDGYVTLDVKPDVSNFVALINNQFPQTNTRQANLSVRIKDGNTLVIGGLLDETDNTAVAKIPFLGDIPIFGNFFRNTTKNRNKNEVVLMVTPKIMD